MSLLDLRRSGGGQPASETRNSSLGTGHPSAETRNSFFGTGHPSPETGNSSFGTGHPSAETRNSYFGTGHPSRMTVSGAPRRSLAPRALWRLEDRFLRARQIRSAAAYPPFPPYRRDNAGPLRGN